MGVFIQFCFCASSILLSNDSEQKGSKIICLPETTSGKAPFPEEITGIPKEIASTAAKQNPSQQDGTILQLEDNKL